MWTMKCFSRETDREILSDFIRLGQIIGGYHLISFFVLSRFFVLFFRQPPKGNQEKVRHVKRVALIKLYPFHNTISNTHTHEVVVLCFE